MQHVGRAVVQDRRQGLALGSMASTAGASSCRMLAEQAAEQAAIQGAQRKWASGGGLRGGRAREMGPKIGPSGYWRVEESMSPALVLFRRPRSTRQATASPARQGRT